MDTLNLKCKHLVCVPTGIRMMQHIMFRPTAKTLRDVRAAITADLPVKLTVSDVSGNSDSKRLHIPLTAIVEHGTIILTTREL